MTLADYLELHQKFSTINKELIALSDQIVGFGAQLSNRPERCGVHGLASYPVERLGEITECIAKDEWPSAQKIAEILTRWHELDVKTEYAYGQLSSEDRKDVPKPRALE